MSNIVLITEDNCQTMLALRRILELRGLAVLPTTTVAEALASLDHPPQPHVALVDLMLPDGMGEEVIEEIRRRRLPMFVVAMTGLGKGERLSRAARSADTVLEKPFGIVEVYELLTRGMLLADSPSE